MRGKRKDLPSTFEGMEQYLLAALDRVKKGCPTNLKLIEKAKKRTLKVNISNVALEAGVSRSLIGYDDCQYKNVRLVILGKEPEEGWKGNQGKEADEGTVVDSKRDDNIPVRVPMDMRSINADLREEKRILEQRWKVALSEQAAMLNRMQKLEAEYNDKVSEIMRINARGERNPYEIAGLHVVGRSAKKSKQ